MVIFLDVDLDNGKNVAKRVIDNFYEANEHLRDEVQVIFDIRTMNPNM